MHQVLFGVLFGAYITSASVYLNDLRQFLGDLPVTKFNLPGFVDKNFTDVEIKECADRRGHWLDGKFVGTPSNYNISEILIMLGGLPGEVEAPKRSEVGEATVEDPDKRPLEDPPQDKWLYNYRSTDYKYYYRLEHAVKRFAGTDKEFLDIRGELAWTPEDTCGFMKVADYRQDDTGFRSEIRTDYCSFRSDNYFTCASIAQCSTKPEGNLICLG